MSQNDDRDRQIAELQAQVDRLKSSPPPKVEVTGGPSTGGGFKGGFFGCLGVIAALIAIVVALGVLGQCSKMAGSASSTAAAGSSAAAQSPSSSAATANWTYTSTSDAMSDKQTKEACTTSSNEVTQSFPYHNSTGQLCIRQSPKFGLDAYIEIDDGQILCGIESCQLPIRFDKAPVQKFTAVGAADNSTNIIFIKRTSVLVAALKKSSTTAVDLTLYQNGVQPLTFRTSGLVWP